MSNYKRKKPKRLSTDACRHIGNCMYAWRWNGPRRKWPGSKSQRNRPMPTEAD